MSASHIFVATQ